MAALQIHLLIVTVAMLAAATPVVLAQGPPPTPGDVIITSDTVWTGTDTTIDGRLRIEPGATLRVLGSTIHVGDRIEVAEGAALELGPHGDRPTILAPLREADGFWIVVFGTINSAGKPDTVIEGLRGDGLATAVSGQGGLQIPGTGTLQDVHVNNSTAGITVRAGGSLLLRDATIQDLGFIGLAALGNLTLRNASVLDHVMGVSGRMTCNIEVEDSHIRSFGDNVATYFCPVTIRNSVLEGSSASVSANGDARIEIQDTTLIGYSVSGISVKPSPSGSGGIGAPTLDVRDTVIEAKPGAKWGLELRGSSSSLHNVTSRQNVYGIEAAGGRLALLDSHLESNEKWGLLAQNVELDVAGTGFGDADLGTTNQLGAISNVVAFAAQAVRANGAAVPGLTLEIFPKDGKTPIFSRTETVTPILTASFDAYHTAPDGQAQYLGPFTFRASHAERAKPMTGTVVENGANLYVDLGGPANAPSVTPGLFLFVLVMLLARPSVGGLGRGRQKP